MSHIIIQNKAKKSPLLVKACVNKNQSDEVLCNTSITKQANVGLNTFNMVESIFPGIMQIHPEGLYYAYRGWLHYLNGDNLQALKDMDKAINIQPDPGYLFKRAIIRYSLCLYKGTRRDLVRGMRDNSVYWHWWRNNELHGLCSSVPLFGNNGVPEKLNEIINSVVLEVLRYTN